jgi:hypothetical protein
MNSTWAAKYIRTRTDEYGRGAEIYTIQVVADHPAYADLANDCWTGYIYNYSTGVWEQKLRSCGTTNIPRVDKAQGWTMWESLHVASRYFSSSCPTLPNIRATNVQVLSASGSFDAIDLSTRPFAMTGSCFNDGTYQFKWVVDYYNVSPWNGDWTVWAPNP